jgi:hypothetical protein
VVVSFPYLGYSSRYTVFPQKTRGIAESTLVSMWQRPYPYSLSESLAISNSSIDDKLSWTGGIFLVTIITAHNSRNSCSSLLWILEFPTAAYGQLWPPVGSPTA